MGFESHEVTWIAASDQVKQCHIKRYGFCVISSDTDPWVTLSDTDHWVTSNDTGIITSITGGW